MNRDVPAGMIAIEMETGTIGEEHVPGVKFKLTFMDSRDVELVLTCEEAYQMAHRIIAVAQQSAFRAKKKGTAPDTH